MLEIGVQTWGAQTTALRHCWASADELGVARITYGDDLAPWTLEAFAHTIARPTISRVQNA